MSYVLDSGNRTVFCTRYLSYATVLYPIGYRCEVCLAVPMDNDNGGMYSLCIMLFMVDWEFDEYAYA